MANSLLFCSSIKEDTNVIFITTNGLNDAKDIIINGKLYQAIGEINTSETENWDKIKQIILDKCSIDWCRISTYC